MFESSWNLVQDVILLPAVCGEEPHHLDDVFHLLMSTPGLPLQLDAEEFPHGGFSVYTGRTDIKNSGSGIAAALFTQEKTAGSIAAARTVAGIEEYSLTPAGAPHTISQVREKAGKDYVLEAVMCGGIRRRPELLGQEACIETGKNQDGIRILFLNNLKTGGPGRAASGVIAFTTILTEYGQPVVIVDNFCAGHGPVSQLQGIMTTSPGCIDIPHRIHLLMLCRSGDMAS